MLSQARSRGFKPPAAISARDSDLKSSNVLLKTFLMMHLPALKIHAQVLLLSDASSIGKDTRTPPASDVAESECIHLLQHAEERLASICSTW